VEDEEDSGADEEEDEFSCAADEEASAEDDGSAEDSWELDEDRSELDCGACDGAASGVAEPLGVEEEEDELLACAPEAPARAAPLAELACNVLPGKALAATSESNAVRATLAAISHRLIRLSL